MFNIIKRILHLHRPRQEKGQSLVEMAIITPLLLFLMLGVFEVGFAVRSQLTLVNVNREITRFAVRPGYMNFSSISDIDASYQLVRDWVDVTLSEQLELDFSDSGNTTLIVSHVVVDTGQPCEDMSSCNCDAFDNPGYNPYPDDDIIIHPDKPGMWYQAKRYGPAVSSTGPKDSRIDYDALVTQELMPQNNKFNCELIKKGGVPSANNIIVTELFIDQPQLFGFPFISNPYTDPVPLYTHTTMRLVSAARSTGTEGGGLLDNIDTIGPVCMAYPITFNEDIFADPDDPAVPQWIDAYEGSSSGNFGWITWNPDPSNNNANYVEKELKVPQLSLNDYTNVNDSTDHSLSIGDAVSTKPGIANSSGVDEQLQGLVGQEIIIPVYKNNPGSGQNSYYEVSHFAKVKIDQICLPRNGSKCDGENSKQIKATFLGYVDDTCTSSGSNPSSSSDNPPVAQNDFAATSKDNSVTINLLGNDSDIDGDTITIEPGSVTQPSKGTVVDNGDGTVTYTPKNNNTGIGVFTFDYTISDGNGNTATATVTVEVLATMPTNTPAPTNTPTPQPTSTSAQTNNTPTPKPGDPTSTPAPTNTPAPPTSTPTPVPPTNTPTPVPPTNTPTLSPTPIPVSTELPWKERFGKSDGTTSDTGGTAWSINKNSTGGYAAVKGKRIDISDTEAKWESEEINIHGINKVKISLKVSSVGDMEDSGNSYDYFYVYYTIDGTSSVFKKFDGNIGSEQTIIQTDLSGSKLQITILARTSTGSEHYYFDTVVVAEQ